MSTDEPRMDRHDDDLTANDQQNFAAFTRRAATAIALAVLIVLAAVVFWRLLNVLLVIFAAILLAVFLRGLANFAAEHSPLSNGWALLAVGVALLVVTAGSGWLLAPTVAEQTSQIAEKFPESIDELQSWAEGSPLGTLIPDEFPSIEEIASGQMVGWSRISGAFSSVAGATTNIIFVLFVGIYLATDPLIYKRGLLRLVPLRYRRRGAEVLDTISHQLGWWLVGRFLSMLAVAVLTTIGLWILGIPLALVLGLLSGLLSFVPIVGPIVSFVPAGMMALLNGPQFVLYTAFVYMGVQAIEGYLITPMIQQRTVSLPPALILIAQLVAGMLFGMIGIIVATPIAVLLIALINMIYIEDVLGDQTPYSDKIPGIEQDRERAVIGDEASQTGAEPDADA